MDYKAFFRRKMMEELYSRLSDEDKRLYVQMTLLDKDHSEIMQAIQELKAQAGKNHHSFGLDLAANLSGNAIWNALVWIGGRIIK